jgi:hypothetical protein
MGWPRFPVVLALAAALLVLPATTWLRRRGTPIRLPGRDALVWRHAALALCFAALAGATLLERGSGFNVDERVQARYGAAIVDWYAAALAGDVRPFEVRPEQVKRYGGLFELLAELAARASPLGRSSTRHLLTAWCGVAALAAVYALGARLHGRATGFVAALMLLLTPRFSGHFFHNPKDVPFATCMLLALQQTCAALGELPRLPARRVLALGAALGAALGIRIGGALAVLLFLGAIAAWLAGDWGRARAEGRRPARATLALLARAAAVCALAWAVMLAAWPWALAAPLRRPFEALRYFDDVAGNLGVDFRVFFEGVDHRLSAVPRHYTIGFFALTMPEFALLFPLALVPAWAWIRTRRPAWPGVATLRWLVVLAAIALPLASTANPTLIQYDDVRHFLFVLPPLALVLAAGLVELVGGARGRALGPAVLVAGVLLAGLTAADMARLHPYESLYFNRSVAGGLRAAARRYETDVLGLSYREGLRALLAGHRPERAAPVRIATCPEFYPNLADALEADPRGARRFRIVGPEGDPELFVAVARNHCDRLFSGRVLHTVERDGVVLLSVLELAPGGR